MRIGIIFEMKKAVLLEKALSVLVQPIEVEQGDALEVFLAAV